MEARFADVPDTLWHHVEPLLPLDIPRPRGGRPRSDNRRVLAGILYRLRTGCQWKSLPKEYFGSGSTCHERFQMGPYVVGIDRLEKQGFRDSALRERKKHELRERFQADLAQCEGHRIPVGTRDCVAKARTIAEVSEGCLR